MALVDNIAQLQQSSAPRSGVPTGNIYFNPDGSLEIITVEELATLPAPISGPNPISNADGVTFRALLEFEANERSTDEALRKLSKFMLGNFKRAGAGKFINGKAPSDVGSSVTGGDRKKIRGYGWDEYADRDATILNRTYHAGFSLGLVEAASVPYIQSAISGAVTDATFPGQLDEAFQTFGTTGNGDAGAGNFDNTAIFISSIRSWNKTHERKNLTDSNLLDAGGYSGKYGIGEANHPFNTFTEVDVFGGVAIAPWSTMVYATLDVARNESGLVGGPFNFSEEIANPVNGTLAQVVALCDALARTDADIDAHATNTRNGKREDTLYTLTATGNVRFKQGIYPENIPVADRAKVILVDDTGTERLYESVAGGVIPVGAVAAADASAFYQMFFEDGQLLEDFDTTSAQTVNDASGTPIKGLVGGLTEIPFDFAFSSNTQSGFAGGTDRPIVIIVEGINGAGSKEERYTITNSTSLSFPCIPGVQDNI